MEPELRESGIAALYLFGSRARGDHRADSDLDLAFEVSEEAEPRFSLWDQAGILARLIERLETQVDFVERRALRPRIRARVEVELQQIF